MRSSYRLAVFARPDAPRSADTALAGLLETLLPSARPAVMPDEVEAPRGLCSAAVRIEADERELTALRAVVRAERVEELAVVLVPVTLLRAERILLVTDVDSTLIEQEVIELLAAHAGREAEVAEVTERAMRGELDFAGSLHHRVRALSGLPVSVIDHVAQRVTPTAGAKELVDAAHRLGHKVGAVSGGFIQVLRPLAQRLGLDHAHANVLAVREGCLTGRVEGPVVDRAAKRESLIRWCEADSIPLEATIGMGDGANDLDLVTTAALGVGLQPKPALRTHVDATLDLRRLDTIAAALGWPLE